ncbi:GpE family phage tail protein, partial [Klebsiella pneumoniae]|uniref:GpE family phage tail protein n=1 Tax=Klebsiella pneumoniae TaxID=573 RepID=UPI0039686E86
MRRDHAFFDETGAVRTERGGDGERIREAVFSDVDDLIADVAVVFHWPPAGVDGVEVGR